VGSTESGTVEGTGFKYPPCKAHEDPAEWAAQNQRQFKIQGSYPPSRHEVQEDMEDPAKWAAQSQVAIAG
jgi:hypothetical protein